MKKRRRTTDNIAKTKGKGQRATKDKGHGRRIEDEAKNESNNGSIKSLQKIN